MVWEMIYSTQVLNICETGGDCGSCRPANIRLDGAGQKMSCWFDLGLCTVAVPRTYIKLTTPVGHGGSVMRGHDVWAVAKAGSECTYHCPQKSTLYYHNGDDCYLDQSLDEKTVFAV
jgi:hypothetical protein